MTSPSMRPRVRRGYTPGTYHVASRTRPETEHLVQTTTGSCSCEAGHSGRARWHLRLCRALDAIDLVGWGTS
jgi:hypothetical protein